MLSDYRKQNNLTLEEMAKLLNLKVTTYCSYEYKKRPIPYDVLIRFLELRNDINDKELANLIKQSIR